MSKKLDEFELGQLAGALILSTPQGQAGAAVLGNTLVQGATGTVATCGALATAGAAAITAVLPVAVIAMCVIGVLSALED
jgi:hypothetical protein